MKKLIFSMFLALSAAISFTACKDDDEDPKNIVQTVQATDDLSSLEAALIRAGLVDALNADGPFTVFAPTNAAFDAFLSANGFANLEAVPVAVLTQVLLNHVVSGEVRAAAVPTEGYVKTLATFGATTYNLSILAQKSAAGAVNINKDVKVSQADILASNGVIHIVDKVIGLPTVVNHALNNANFSSLVAALTRPDLGVDYVTLLSGPGPFTVFAPTNAAFAALLTELNLPNLAAVPAATLNAVLQYHVVNGANVVASTLTNGQEVTTFGGGKFTINLTGGAKIVDAKSRTSNIIITDVQGTNGVVHAIDKVLLP